MCMFKAVFLNAFRCEVMIQENVSTNPIYIEFSPVILYFSYYHTPNIPNPPKGWQCTCDAPGVLGVYGWVRLLTGLYHKKYVY